MWCRSLTNTKLLLVFFVEQGGAGILGGGGGAGISAQLLSLQAAACQIRRELQELLTNKMADRVLFTKHFTVVNGNLRRINVYPGVRGGRRSTPGDDDGIAAAALTAIAGRGAPPSLSPNPKNPFELWDEYQVGIGGRKAAHLFSQAERGGKVKHSKYCRRKVIWTMVSGLVRQGYTSDTAIDLIYSVYGQQISVTNILNQIKKDRKDGTLNPNLRF